MAADSSRFVLVLAAVLAIVSCDHDLIREEQFATAADARDAGAIERGIVPIWIPDDAIRIRVMTELDRNWVWVKFEIPAASESSLEARLLPVSQGRYQGEGGWRMSGPSWWPQCLIELKTETCQPREAIYAGASFLLAVDRTSHTGFAWTSPSIARDLDGQK